MPFYGAVARSPPSPIQSSTDKRDKRTSAAVERAVDARSESAVSDNSATTAETILCVAVTSAPAVNDSGVDAAADEHPRRRSGNPPLS